MPYSGTFDTFFGENASFTGNTLLYVAALKYRPDLDLSAEDLLVGYDVQVFKPTDWTGRDELPFKLYVPTHSLVYLWAYADIEPNGMVNEPFEPVGSGGDDGHGRIATTTTSISDRIVEMRMETE